MSTSEWIQVYGGNLQVALFFGLFMLLAVAERLIPGCPGGLARGGRWPANIGLTVLNLIVLGALPVSFITAAHWASTQGWGVRNTLMSRARIRERNVFLLSPKSSAARIWLPRVAASAAVNSGSSTCRITRS